MKTLEQRRDETVKKLARQNHVLAVRSSKDLKWLSAPARKLRRLKFEGEADVLEEFVRGQVAKTQERGLFS